MTTSLFGRRKFGSFTFGPSTLSQTRYGLEVDWDGDGYFDGTDEGTNLQDLSIDRGRKYTISAEGDAFEEEETGRFSAVLLDAEQRYDPYNVSSPLFGNLTGGKLFRVKAHTTSGEIYPLMAGTIDEPVSYMDRGLPAARLVGTDGWAFLRNQLNQVTIPLQENIYAEDAIMQVLNAASWPRTWGSDLGAGVDVRPYFWVEEQSAAQVIHNVALNELGKVNIAANGALTFRPRITLETVVLTLTDIDVTNVQRMAPGDVIRNMIKVTSAPRSEQALQVVWEIPGRLEVPAGTTLTDVFAEFTYNRETVPVKNPVTPVSSTDFNATANEDGSGASLTGDVSISMYPFSTRAQLSVTNSGLTTAYVYIRIRGIPLANVGSVSFDYRDEDSIRQFGPRPFLFSVDQNVNVARQYRELLAALLTIAKNYLVVDLMPNPDLQFSLDLGQIIQANLSNYGISAQFRLVRISHRFSDVNGVVVNTRWWLEPYTRLWTGVQIPFQLPVQLGA